MGKFIQCFVPYADAAQVKATIEGLKSTDQVSDIFLLATTPDAAPVEGCVVSVSYTHLDVYKRQGLK